MQERDFSPEILARLRTLDACAVLPVVCAYAKRDATFAPVKSAVSQRWDCNPGGRDFELLLTGPKWRSRTP